MLIHRFRTWRMDAGGLGRYNQNEASQSSILYIAAFPLRCFEVFAFDLRSNMSLTEADIPGSSLSGREPSCLKAEELRFWLKCRGDSLKGLKTKAQLVIIIIIII